jgi:hypothetical protein
MQIFSDMEKKVPLVNLTDLTFVNSLIFYDQVRDLRGFLKFFGSRRSNRSNLSPTK